VIVGLGIKLKSMSVRSWLEVDITSFASKSSYCSKGAPQKANLSLALVYVMTDAYGFLCFLAIFSATLVDSVAFWCHPSACCKDKGIE